MCACACLLGALAAGAGPLAAQARPHVSLDAQAGDTRSGAVGPGLRLVVSAPLGERTDSGPRLDVRLGRMRVAQGATVKIVTEAGADLDSLVSLAGLPVELGASVWLDGLRPQQVGGYAQTAARVGKRDTLRVRISRDPIWKTSEGVDPLRGLRVRDLRQIDWRLSTTDLRVSLESSGTSRTSFLFEGGGTLQDDGNRRGFFAAEVSVPVVRHPLLDLRVGPTGYAEHFARTTAGYFTPGGYASAGLELRAASHLGPLETRASARPHVFRYPGLGGVGMAAEFEASISASRFAFSVWGELLHQGPYRFTQIGIGAHVR
ncbi:MAG TPA: hypothetical protein VFQ22_00810 [Longimicrobiales bacterium]|nr:hypothetical protein [Longimicrobiales bacterium]